LNEEPVVAGPPSAAYRIRKFTRRNRTLVTAGLAIALALTLGFSVAVVALAWMPIQAIRLKIAA
jgi:hypothetical protein